MNPNSPSQLTLTLGPSDGPQETNYVPMTPGTLEFSSLGKQVPPPAHMGFRSSPKTPPRRPTLISDCQPPPVDRHLKPDRKGEGGWEEGLCVLGTEQCVLGMEVCVYKVCVCVLLCV